MGYSAEIIEENFFIKVENFDKAYDAMCKLNAKDGLKQDYSYLGYDERPTNSKSVSSDPRKHFSFMPWNYDELYKNLFEVLNALSFDVFTNDKGDINSIYFCNRLGQEDLFLEAIAPYVKPGSYIVWRGEDGAMWVFLFEDGEMTEKEVYLTW